MSKIDPWETELRLDENERRISELLTSMTTIAEVLQSVRKDKDRIVDIIDILQERQKEMLERVEKEMVAVSVIMTQIQKVLVRIQHGDR